MNTRLTLTSEKNIVKAMRGYTRIPKTKATPIVNSLKGAFKVPAGFDYKEALSDALVEKHLQ